MPNTFKIAGLIRSRVYRVVHPINDGMGIVVDTLCDDPLVDLMNEVFSLQSPEEIIEDHVEDHQFWDD